MAVIPAVPQDRKVIHGGYVHLPVVDNMGMCCWEGILPHHHRAIVGCQIDPYNGGRDRKQGRACHGRHGIVFRPAPGIPYAYGVTGGKD